MKKEEHNFGVQHNFICIFRTLYFSYSEYFLFSIFHILYFPHFAFVRILLNAFNCIILVRYLLCKVGFD